MKNIDTIFHFIQNNLSYEKFTEQLQLKQTPGINAEQIQEKLGIVRNNGSTFLNQLHKKKMLTKLNTRPVCFVPQNFIYRFCEEYHVSLKDVYNPDELFEIISANAVNDPFEQLLGHDGSLIQQVRQAKAAIIYPPKGLHTLILGQSGVGKTTFAAAMHSYGAYIRKKTDKEYPFITFNCADYFNNPQLLLAKLFGYTKNAFTGADEDKIGLVEKANGGILFLDEIHRLPPNGQEMLFYLMDKGEYSRLGENTARHKADLLIIGATTENPENILLSTFIRRIPVTIKLPSFMQKPISERVEIIDYFFRYESLNLKQSLSLAPEVLKALAVYSFSTGNIGQLRSEIKLLCANAFLQNLQDNKSFHIDFQALNDKIKSSFFDIAKLDEETKQYLNMFSETVIITPHKKIDDTLLDHPTELYNQITNRLTTLRSQGINKHIIHDLLQNDIDNYFSNLMKEVDDSTTDINTLYKVVPREIVDATVKLVEFAQHHLSINFKNKFIFGLCFHINALLKRTNKTQKLPIPQLSEIKKEHPKELQIAHEMVKRLEIKFNTPINSYEQCFLALLLVQNKENDNGEQDRIGIIICCHGDTTASSIANVANTLLNTTWLKAIDMPLTASIDKTYMKFRSMAVSVHRNKGILLLVDMGSLYDFGKRLQQETGIMTKVVDNISTPLAIELLRKVLYKTNDLSTIYQFTITPSESDTDKKPAILSLCMTGEGASKMAYEVIKKLLPPEYYEKVDIIVTNYFDIKVNYPRLLKNNTFIAVVGNIDPQLGIPYFPIGQLLNEDSQKSFFKLIDNGCKKNKQEPIELNVYGKAKLLLEQYVRYVNPKTAVKDIEKFVEDINYPLESEDKRLNLVVHLGCMLDRCVHQDAIYFDDIRSYIHSHKPLFETIRLATDNLAANYDIKVNDDEVCYIIKVLETNS
ncbi:sigma 54-interacting transcriptional regulator [Pectinatus frisingensis]|uniref:sigma 54-interacting transcriptional regulator n=1 Tax=Pectinatus frisingensis TaxID=865 RepID=UPI0018C4EFA3|nr:sigma-54-dependent transcriptional regulator [Pectinatus frisingensis]